MMAETKWHCPRTLRVVVLLEQDELAATLGDKFAVNLAKVALHLVKGGCVGTAAS